MTLLQLPLWDFFKSFDDYPQYFDNSAYFLYVFIFILGLVLIAVILVAIYCSVYNYFDKKSSTKKTMYGNLIDKRYIGEQSTSGTGTAIMPNGSGGVGVGLVSTSSHSDEEFLFFVKSDKVYKIEVDMQQFYGRNMGDTVQFEITIGGISKDELNVSLTN